MTALLLLILLLAGSGVLYVKTQIKTPPLPPAQVVQKVKDTYAALTSYSDSGKITSQIGGMTITTTTVLTVTWTYRTIATAAILVTPGGPGDGLAVPGDAASAIPRP